MALSRSPIRTDIVKRSSTRSTGEYSASSKAPGGAGRSRQSRIRPDRLLTRAILQNRDRQGAAEPKATASQIDSFQLIHHVSAAAFITDSRPLSRRVQVHADPSLEGN